MAFALVTSQLMLLAPSTAVAAPTISVDSTGDDPDFNPGDGICGTTNGGGTCTLRAAIQEANASTSVDEIHFDIPGASGATHVIEPLSVLPWITSPVSIDATTQAGYSGAPLIVVDGSSAPPIADGPDAFMVDADDVVITGFEIRDWHDDGVELHGDRSVVTANHIYNNDEGVLTEDGDDNLIGGLVSADRNVISGNRVGISIHDGIGNQILGNYVGTDASGTGAIANQESGVYLWSSARDVRIEGNVISGNTRHGVFVDHASHVTVADNRVGTNAAGTSAVPNRDDGINVTNGHEVWIGPGNVISGNGDGDGDHGVQLEEAATEVEIFGNRIGTDGSGASAVPNARNGVHADADAVLIADNQVSGNGEDGLRLEQQGAVVRGNLIGTDSAGTGPLPNGDDGIDTGSGTTGSDIGGVDPGEGNVIAFNVDDGIVLRNHPGTQAAIVSNSIFGNGGLGIDLLGDGVTANDYTPTIDGDTGPNDLLNHPEIDLAAAAEGTIYTQFDLPVPDGHYRIEFFVSPLRCRSLRARRG
jgi:CSLREA domain-containing protein